MIKARFFSQLVLLVLVLVVAIGSFSPVISQQSRSEIRGVWLTSNDTNTVHDRLKLQNAVNLLSRLNFNTLYPVVWNAGYVMYPSAIAQQTGIQPFVYKGSDGQDMLTDLIDQAHRQNLLVIPWFEFGFMAPPTSELATNHPDWLTQRQDGSQTSISDEGEVAWLNPLLPEVQQFIIGLVIELVTQYPIDGIQFDDHTSLPSEFGYDRYTTALYTKETKKTPPINPQDPAWVRWRADKITAFMSRLHKAIKTKKPTIIFSVSPNYYDLAYKYSLQDWLAWVRKGIVDELIVQVYRPDLASFVDLLNRPEFRETQQKIPTGVGVLAGLRNKPVTMQQIQSQVQAARERGLGVAFFYYETLWDSAPEPASDRQSGFQYLFPNPAPRTAAL